MPVESARRQDKLVKHWYARLGIWCVCVSFRVWIGLGLVWGYAALSAA